MLNRYGQVVNTQYIPDIQGLVRHKFCRGMSYRSKVAAFHGRIRSREFSTIAMTISVSLLGICFMLFLFVRHKLSAGYQGGSVANHISDHKNVQQSLNSNLKIHPPSTLDASNPNGLSPRNENDLTLASLVLPPRDPEDSNFENQYTVTPKSPAANGEEAKQTKLGRGKMEKYDSWEIGTGSVTFDGVTVKCKDGYGYYHRPVDWEFEKRQNGIWQKPWAPQEGKYFLPFCHTGRISNRLRCLRGALLLAGLLNRTLIVPLDVPSLRQDSRPHIDVGYVNQCVGDNTAISLDDYKEKFGDPAVVDHAICVDTHCVTEDREKWSAGIAQLKWYADIVISKTVTKWNRPSIMPATGESILAKYGQIGKGVLYVHTDYYMDLVDAPYFRDGYVVDAPFKRRGQCPSNLVMQPPEPIISAARAYADYHFPDGKFMAVHVRLGDFKTYCAKTAVNCLDNTTEISSCLRSQLERARLTSLYIATGGSPAQVKEIYEGIGLVNGQNVTYMDNKRHLQMPRTYPRGKLEKNGFDMRVANVRASFEKVVCSQSLIFVGSLGSSFTADIMRLRHGFGTSTCADDNHCGPPR